MPSPQVIVMKYAQRFYKITTFLQEDLQPTPRQYLVQGWICVFKLRTESYTSNVGLLTYSLTDWLTHLSAKIILKTWQTIVKSYSGQTLTRLQALIFLPWTWWKSPARWEKKIRTRSLWEAIVRETFFNDFICHPQV